MNFVVQCVLLSIGFFLGLLYTAMVVPSLFYGLPKAFLGCWRNELSAKVIIPFLTAPLFWTAFSIGAWFGLAFIWPKAFEYLYQSPAFNFGGALGSIFAIADLILGRKTGIEMRSEFDEFVLPYRRQ